jgi:hypothetical protein
MPSHGVGLCGGISEVERQTFVAAGRGRTADRDSNAVCWTDGFAEGSVGPRPCGNWNVFLAGSGQWGPITIQLKGNPKCHRFVCG